MWCEQLLSHLALQQLLIFHLLLLNLVLLQHILDGGDVSDVLRYNLVHEVHPFPDECFNWEPVIVILITAVEKLVTW